jgi:homoserine dehydrogenase
VHEYFTACSDEITRLYRSKTGSMGRLCVGLIGPGLIGKSLVQQLGQQVRATLRAIHPVLHRWASTWHILGEVKRAPCSALKHCCHLPHCATQTPYLRDKLGIHLSLVAVANSKRQLLADVDAAPLQLAGDWLERLQLQVRGRRG